MEKKYLVIERLRTAAREHRRKVQNGANPALHVALAARLESKADQYEEELHAEGGDHV